jgi:hypothetical protein
MAQVYTRISRDSVTRPRLQDQLGKEGWKRLVSILEATLAEVLEVEVEAADRMAASGEDSIAATFAIGGFESPKVASRKG